MKILYYNKLINIKLKRKLAYLTNFIFVVIHYDLHLCA